MWQSGCILRRSAFRRRSPSETCARLPSRQRDRAHRARSRSPVDEDRPGRTFVPVGDATNQRRFSGPVWSHDAEQLATFHREGYIRQRLEAPEVLGNGLDVQHSRGLAYLPWTGAHLELCSARFRNQDRRRTPAGPNTAGSTPRGRNNTPSEHKAKQTLPIQRNGGAELRGGGSDKNCRQKRDQRLLHGRQE